MLTPAAGPAIAAAYGLGSRAVLTGPVARGEQGQVWRLETDRGAYAVKAPFQPIEDAEAEADAAYQDLVHRHGVRMPRVVRTVDRAVVARLDDGTPVRVYEWIDVLPRDRGLDAAELGRVIAHVHSAVQPVDVAMAGWYVDPVGSERWHVLVDELRAAGAPFADDLAAVLPAVLEVEGLLAPRRATQRCHLDLFSDNVRRTPPGETAVLDWENSGPGEPSLELGAALVEFGLDDPRRIGALHTAYVDAGGPGRVASPADLTMVVAQLGHIGELGCRRWLAETDPAERDHLERWVREFVDEPVTPAIVEGILDSVSSPRRS